MNRIRSSSVESKDKYQSYQSKYCQNRIQSLICSRHEIDSDFFPLGHHYNQEYKKESYVSNSDLKIQIDLLQCTIDKMLNYGAFGETGSPYPSEIISETLKLEYYQMMSALKELENILSLKRKKIDKITLKDNSSNNNSQVHDLKTKICNRDALIKSLSDRIETLYKANDQLMMDYENQENVLSEELICLQGQLEKAKDAMRTLIIFKKRRKKSTSQEVDSEIFYLRESLSTKEVIIADLKDRIEKLNQKDIDLNLQSHDLASQFEREILKKENFEHFNVEYEELRQRNEDASSEYDERYHFKKELMDMSRKLTDVVNHNNELEQQSSSYRQKVTDQDLAIEDLKIELSKFEVERSRASQDFDKERISTQRELNELQKEYYFQCEINVRLKEEVGDLKISKDKSHQEQLDQLDDSRTRIEQLTKENSLLMAVVNENGHQMDELRQGLKKSSECIKEKEEEVKEYKTRIELLEKDMRAVEMERRSLFRSPDDYLPINIDGLKDEQAQLGDENNKDKEVIYFGEGLLSTLNQPSRHSDKEPSCSDEMRVDSLQEYHQKWNINHLLSVTFKSIETQTILEDMNILLSSSGNTISHHSIMEGKPKNDKKDDHCRENKMSAPKNKNSNKIEDIGDGVLGLQQAIDEYNSLLADVVFLKEVDLSATDCTKRDVGSSKLFDKTLPCRTRSVSPVLAPLDQLVTLDEVKLAVNGEMSIKNLRRFAILLAEDNFDLSAEIKKLFATIEDLRKQLKENVELLSESVEMLENCENFVSGVEERLGIETRKTESICGRYGPSEEGESGEWRLMVVEELKGLSAELVVELQRLLQGCSSPNDPAVQGRCGYLLRCINEVNSLKGEPHCLTDHVSQ